MGAAYDFRKEEDVKQYLHNIGIEYRFGCYSEKNPEVCHLLGMYLEVIKTNVEQAKKVFKVNCDTYNWRFSCYKYGHILDQEKKPELMDEVIDYYSRGCEAGFSKSCLMGGVRCGAKAEKLTNLEEKRKLYTKALKYMDIACTDKIGQSCFQLSSIYFHGIPETNYKKDLTKVLEYAVKGCENDHIHSCVNASLMYLKGEGTEKNPKLAKKYKLRAEELEKLYTTADSGVQFEEGLR